MCEDESDLEDMTIQDIVNAENCERDNEEVTDYDGDITPGSYILMSTTIDYMPCTEGVTTADTALAERLLQQSTPNGYRLSEFHPQTQTDVPTEGAINPSSSPIAGPSSKYDECLVEVAVYGYRNV
ncbi:hypothetical protein NQ318_023237 [Aromia moschata]|uniref:Uncharacterized protein n=1 Tax=Aromia moschata TaxID=1265417 RepID=A0AAV8XLY8_9CUCU|nr:hypothetical protein NQ318_023237 [Aromia moschata]